MLQPHAWSWRASEDIGNTPNSDVRLVESFGHMRKLGIPYPRPRFNGHTGYDIALTREMYDQIRGFYSLPGPGGDYLMWSLLFRNELAEKDNPFKEHILEIAKNTNLPSPMIGCADLVCFHNKHGQYKERNSTYAKMGSNKRFATNNYGKNEVPERPE